MAGRCKVSYYHDPDFGNYHYGDGHFMKPQRVRMATNLVARYDLLRDLNLFTPKPASKATISQFHSEDYVEFLSTVTEDNQEDLERQMKRFNLVGDCPRFPEVWQYCQSYAGGSIGGAVQLNHKQADVVINWAGGLHHAQKSAAAGFCYVNDIVLAILELLKYHKRVLYLDIDVHHGDGVQEAFHTSNRVLTVSFHKYGKGFFPYPSGSIDSVGKGAGHNYCVNIPLHDGMDDATYAALFRPIMTKVMAVYQPEAIVLQSGADSLAGDKIGTFNLTTRGHGACHAFMKTFGVPMLVLGGGGYTAKNVARCWAYETGVLLGREMSDALPPNEFYKRYGPDYTLHVPRDPCNPNQNRRDQLEKLRNKILSNLNKIAAVGTSFHQPPPDALPLDAVASNSCNLGSSSMRPQSSANSRSTGTASDASDWADDEGEGEMKPLKRLRRGDSCASFGLHAQPRTCM